MSGENRGTDDAEHLLVMHQKKPVQATGNNRSTTGAEVYPNGPMLPTKSSQVSAAN